jgi:hypothetical protein
MTPMNPLSDRTVVHGLYGEGDPIRLARTGSTQ